MNKYLNKKEGPLHPSEKPKPPAKPKEPSGPEAPPTPSWPGKSIWANEQWMENLLNTIYYRMTTAIGETLLDLAEELEADGTVTLPKKTISVEPDKNAGKEYETETEIKRPTNFRKKIEARANSQFKKRGGRE
jgi:hypothetical protein